MDTIKNYIPALRFSWLTRFYDPLLCLVMREAQFKKELVLQARIKPGQNVLDVGQQP